MKKIILFGAILLTSSIFAQVGIGTTTPHKSSILELKSNSAGLILPRLDISDIDDPQTGTIVYNSETDQICVYSTKWDCYPNNNTLAATTLFNQSAFLNINGIFIYGNGLKNQNLSLNPSTTTVTAFTDPCNGQCDASQFGMIKSGNHVLGFSLRRGNSSVSGNYVILRALVGGNVVNEEAFAFPNINSGDIVPFQFKFSCASDAQIQIQAGNGLNDAGIKFNYLQSN